MSNWPRRGLAAVVVCGSILASLAPGAGAATVALGAAESFGVLGGTTVTSAGVSTITGDLGVSPGTAITGFPPGLLFGTMHAGDATAVAGHAAVAAAYGDAVGRGPEIPITGDLGGQTLGPGVYAAGAALTLAGELRLDGGQDPNAVFVLKAGSTLGTAAFSSVKLVGQAQACNVFWIVGSSATLGATSVLRGSILATTSISLGAGVTIVGRALARDGAVTMINDIVTVPQCVAGELSNTAPTIAPFTTQLTGLTQIIRTAVGAWSVSDARGSGAGYRVTVAASLPTVTGGAGAPPARVAANPDADDRDRSARQSGGHRTGLPPGATTRPDRHHDRLRPGRHRPGDVDVRRRRRRAGHRDPGRRQRRRLPQHPHLHHRPARRLIDGPRPAS